MVRLNIFKNPQIESFVSHYRIQHEENIRKETEEFWRNRIVLELYENYIDGFIKKSLDNPKNRDYAIAVEVLMEATKRIQLSNEH